MLYLKSLLVALALCALTHKCAGQLNITDNRKPLVNISYPGQPNITGDEQPPINISYPGQPNITDNEQPLINISYAGQLNITGNEQPLVIGLSHDIHCTWNGETKATMMEWFIVGLENAAVETVTESWRTVLTLDPDNDALDGTMFACRATLTDGREVEENITLAVEAIENMVNITSSMDTATAGQQFTLTCTVFSGGPSEVSWIDSDGVACPPDGQGVSVSYYNISDQISILELTFQSIRTSQSGLYKCISNIAIPPSKSEASFLVQVQIPEPTVSIFRVPEHPLVLFTTDSLVLNCVIELIPEVDSHIAISSQWSGHSSLYNSSRRVTITDLEGEKLTYNTSVTFEPLKSSDSGSYVCSSTVSPLSESMNLIGSPRNEEEIKLSVALKVTIEVTYNPPSDFTLPSPPYYRPATSVTLTCQAYGASGRVRYQWSSTCASCSASSSTARSVSVSVLKSIDAGVHTCTVTDKSGNIGSNSTEMKLIGAGLYVDSYNDYTAPNNSLITKSYSRQVTVHCYSNSTSTNIGYYIFPDGISKYSTFDYLDYRVNRETSGVYIQAERYNTPDIWGIFTCEIPDSDGNIVETSIGIYSSTPYPPFVYSSSYFDMSNTEGSVLGTLECLTRYSPPTTVIWLRDGAAVHVDGVGYEMMQIVTDRRNSLYKNILLIRNATDLAGNHTYTCSVSNAAGSRSQNISTALTAQPAVDVSVSGEAVYLTTFNMTCTASLNAKVASQLIQFLVLDWVMEDGVSVSRMDGVTLEKQHVFSDTSTRSLVFDSLKNTHEATYKCEAKLILPDSESFNTSLLYHINVLNRTIIQLRFGPMVHCSKWYEDESIAENLEQDIKKTLSSVINENCSCDFRQSHISHGEFSCQTQQDNHVIYRAYLTSNSDTLPPPQLLAVIQDWVTKDGTFLYTYHGRTRLRLDPLCPLEITSFSQPEC